MAQMSNTSVDWLIWRSLDQSKRMLKKESFHQICHRFGTVKVNLFTSELNHEVPKFITRRCLLAIEIDSQSCFKE